MYQNQSTDLWIGVKYLTIKCFGAWIIVPWIIYVEDTCSEVWFYNKIDIYIYNINLLLDIDKVKYR
jgi:hypothetical protein